MYFYYLLTVLIIATTLFSYVNHKWLKWPAPIAVMVFSLLTSLLLLVVKNHFPTITAVAVQSMASIDFYNVVMKVVLGFLLFAGAFHTSVEDLKKEVKPILALALCGTFASTFIVGFLLFGFLHFIDIHMPLINCLLFGALISPTDPVAVLGILKKAGVSKSFELQVVGESLINDGVAIVLFTTIYEVAISSDHQFNLLGTLLLFLKEAGGGASLGLLLGIGGYYALKPMNDYKIEILLTLIIVMGGYALADLIHVSGPLAMVIAGLITGSESKKNVMSDVSKKYVSVFWDLTDNFLNVILFLLMGFEILILPTNILVVILGVVSIFIVLVSRYLSVLLPVLLLRQQFKKHAPLLLTWSALRGVVSIALALSIPADMFRYEFLTITYIIAVFSIIVQGLTLGKLSKHLGAAAGMVNETEEVALIGIEEMQKDM